jgi:hypothetical protein
MARIYPGDYADRAYERYHAKLDREAKSKGGGQGNGRLLQSKHQENGSNLTDSGSQRAGLEFFHNHVDLINLRRTGKTMEEIAIETGNSRVSVFRTFQKLPSNKLKLQLSIPT